MKSQAATKNGSLHDLQIEALVAEIEEQVRLDAGPEVTSEAIGKAVLGVLRIHDGVAYVRFASVHQSFTDAQQLAEAAAEVSGPTRAEVLLDDNAVDPPGSADRLPPSAADPS